MKSQFSNTSDCMYLFKLYDRLLSNCTIAILLGNVLVNNCSEISKIWLIWWMVYTCTVLSGRVGGSWKVG